MDALGNDRAKADDGDGGGESRGSVVLAGVALPSPGPGALVGSLARSEGNVEADVHPVERRLFLLGVDRARGLLVPSEGHAEGPVDVEHVDEQVDRDEEVDDVVGVRLSASEQVLHVLEEDDREGKSDEDAGQDEDEGVDELERHVGGGGPVGEELSDAARVDDEGGSLEEEVDVADVVHEGSQGEHVDEAADGVVEDAELGAAVDGSDDRSPGEVARGKREVELRVGRVPVDGVREDGGLRSNELLQASCDGDEIEQDADELRADTRRDAALRRVRAKDDAGGGGGGERGMGVSFASGDFLFEKRTAATSRVLIWDLQGNLPGDDLEDDAERDCIEDVVVSVCFADADLERVDG